MKKIINSALSFMLVLLTVLPSIASPQTVEAAAGLKDGEYTVAFKTLQPDEEKESSMGSHMESLATLNVKDGKNKITLKLTNNKQITVFQVNNKGALVDAEVVDINEKKDTRDVSFEVEDLSSKLDAYVEVNVPAANYLGKHKFRIAFDESTIQEIVKDEPKPEVKPEPEVKPVEKPEPKPETITLENGKYTISVKALHADEDKASGMAKYVKEEAVLTIKDSKPMLTLTILDHKIITGFQIEHAGTLIEPVDKVINEKDNTRDIMFALNDISVLENAQVQYSMMGHKGDQPLRLSFAKNSIQEVVIDSPSTPEEEPTEKPEKPLEFEIPFKVLKSDNDDISSAGDNIGNPGKLIIKNGQYEVIVTMTATNFFKEFKTEVNESGKYKEVETLEINEKEKTRTVKFIVKDLNKVLNAKVGIDTPFAWMDHDIRIVFDTTGLDLPEDNDKVDPVLPEKPESNDNKEPSTPNKPVDTDTEKPEIDVIDPHNLINGTYTIPFDVLHETNAETSLMMQYVKSPAYLRVKDGRYYIALTLLSSSWITGFQTEVNGKLIQPKVLSTENDTRIVEFEVKDIFSLLNASISVDVPGVYSADHKVRFSFDTKGIELVSKDEYPELGFDRDNDAEKEIVETDEKVPVAGNNTNNPKTADSTNPVKVMFLGLLLVGSLVPLVVRYRRRLVK